MIVPLPGQAYLSLLGLASVAMSIGFSFGFCSLLGLPYGPLHNMIPFLLLGIGQTSLPVCCWSNRLTNHIVQVLMTCSSPCSASTTWTLRRGGNQWRRGSVSPWREQGRPSLVSSSLAGSQSDLIIVFQSPHSLTSWLLLLEEPQCCPP